MQKKKVEYYQNSNSDFDKDFLDQFSQSEKWWDYTDTPLRSMWLDSGLFLRERGIRRGVSDISAAQTALFFPWMSIEENESDQYDEIVYQKAEITSKKMLVTHANQLKEFDIQRKYLDFEFEETKNIMSVEDNRALYSVSNDLSSDSIKILKSKYKFFGYMIGLLDGFIEKNKYKDDDEMIRYQSYRKSVAHDFLEYNESLPTIDIKAISDAISSYPDVEELDYFCYEVYPKVLFPTASPEQAFKDFYGHGYALASSTIQNMEGIMKLYGQLYDDIQFNLKLENSDHEKPKQKVNSKK